MSRVLLDGAERAYGAELVEAFARDAVVLTPATDTGEPLDVLLLNRPLVRETARLADITDAALADVLEDQVFSVVEQVQTLLPRLGSSSRIVVVSARGHLGAWGGAHLMAASAGLIGLVRSLALELGERGIRVNALAPDFAGERWDGPATRREVAEAARFLARPDMSLLSGQTLLLDGMRSLRMSEARRQ